MSRPAKLLRAARTKHKATLAYVAGYCGVTVAYICDIEHGRRHLTPVLAKKCALALGQCPLEWVRASLQQQLDEAGLRMAVVILGPEAP